MLLGQFSNVAEEFAIGNCSIVAEVFATGKLFRVHSVQVRGCPEHEDDVEDDVGTTWRTT